MHQLRLPATLVSLALALPAVLPWPATASGDHEPGPAPGLELSVPPGAVARGVQDVEVVTDTGRFPARVHFPATPDGGMDPATGQTAIAQGRHPVIVFGHGYLGRVEWYASTLDHLAQHGFIVVAPRSALELLPDQESYVEDFRRVLDWLEAEDERPGSWLEGHVLRGAYGAAGHSMGGGASIVAAARDPRFRAVATLAAAELRAGAVEAAAELEAPLLLVAGSGDVVTPVAVHQRPMYEAKTSGPVQLRVIEGGSHCGYLDPLPFGVLCDRASIGEETQRAISRQLLTAWFLYLLADRDDLAAVVWPEAPLPGVGLEGRA